MPKIKEVIEAREIKPILNEEQARRVEAIATRDGELSKIDILSTVCGVARLQEVYHVDRLKNQREDRGTKPQTPPQYR